MAMLNEFNQSLNKMVESLLPPKLMKQEFQTKDCVCSFIQEIWSE